MYNLYVGDYVIFVTEDETIKLIPNINFDQTNYFDSTNEVLQLFLCQNIHICSIIIDNLRCQSKGIELLKTTSVNPKKFF